MARSEDSSAVERLDRAQRQRAWLGMPIAIAYKYVEDDGGYLAALITFYGFVSLFPLLLLLTTVLGFVLQGDSHLRDQLLDSALRQLPIVGQQIKVQGAHGSIFAVVVGLITALFGGLGVAQAVQYTLDNVWAVPKARRPGPVHSRLRSLWLLLVGGIGIAATTALSAMSAGASRYAHGTGAGTGVRILALIAAVLLNGALFLVIFRVLTTRQVSTRQVVPGAMAAAVGWQLLQWIGAWFVSHQLKGSTGSYGIFGAVLGLLAFLYLASTMLVICAELNVVRAYRLWPRALLSPFAEDTELTSADRRAYTSYAKAARHKRAQRIRVTYHQAEEPAKPAEQPEGPSDAKGPAAVHPK